MLFMPPTESSSPQPDPAIEKALLRKQAARHRSSLMARSPCGDNSSRQLEVVLQRCGTGIYAAYLPIRSNCHHCRLSPHWRLGVPPPCRHAAARKSADLLSLAPGMRLDDGPYNTKQPPLSSESVIPDVILAPMLAFDAGCWRLGYGGGFYDRSIASLRDSGHEVVAIGIAFAGQQVDKVPTGPYDMALDAVWTPDGVIWRDAAAQMSGHT